MRLNVRARVLTIFESDVTGFKEMKRRSDGPVAPSSSDEESDEDTGFGTGVQITDDDRLEILMRHGERQSLRRIARDLGLGRAGIKKCARI